MKNTILAMALTLLSLNSFADTEYDLESLENKSSFAWSCFNGFDRPGDDLTSYVGVSYPLCRHFCETTNGCSAFYFVQGPGHCFLKQNATGNWEQKNFENGVYCYR